jgi:hypothetical protein
MADSIISSATVAAVETKVEAAVAKSESPVLAFIKAHYAKVAYAVIGAVLYFVARKFI